MTTKQIQRLLPHIAGLLTLLLAGGLLLSACGYPTPQGGGALTPFVVVVTPTELPDRLTAFAQATAQALYTPTPEPTDTPTPTKQVATTAAPPNPQSKPTPTLAVTGDEYVVQEGDTLLGIAIRLKVDYDQLVALNKISDPNTIQIGQKLKLPPRATPTKAP